MYGGENSGMPLGPDPVNNGTGTFGADDNYDQPAAIVSGGDDGGAVAFDSGNKKNNSAKFFGHRSRESATKADAAQAQANAELAAASSIASNPNNPEFFRQAAVENTTSQIQRQPRQINKKPFIVAGVVLLVGALIACLCIFVLPILFRPYPNGMKAETISEVLTNDKIDTVIKLEEGVLNTYRSPMYISARTAFGERNNNYIALLKEELNTYKELYEQLSKYEAMQYREDTAEYFKNIKVKMAKMIPIYEGIINKIELLFGVVYDGASLDTISSLPGYSNSIGTDINKVSQLRKANNYYLSLNCSTEQDQTVGSTCYNAKQNLRNLEDSAKVGSVDLRKIVFSDIEDESLFKDNSVKKDLRSIQYAPENKTVGDD